MTTRPATTIRAATLADAAGIARVHVETWRSTYPGIVPEAYLASLSVEARTVRWAQMLEAPPPGQHFVATTEPEEAIVGFASGGPEQSGRHPRFLGELYAIYILPAHQGQGLGRRLTRAIADSLADRGLTSMLVWVLADNPWRRFYEALGGQLIAEQPIEIGGARLSEVAYGWTDTQALREAESSPGAGS